MKKKLTAGATLAGLIITCGFAGLVQAQTSTTLNPADGLTEQQAIEIALKEVPGTVNEVERERHRGLSIYEVEVQAADGTEMKVKIAAESGDVLKVKADGEGCDKKEKYNKNKRNKEKRDDA